MCTDISGKCAHDVSEKMGTLADLICIKTGANNEADKD